MGQLFKIDNLINYVPINHKDVNITLCYLKVFPVFSLINSRKRDPEFSPNYLISSCPSESWSHLFLSGLIRPTIRTRAHFPGSSADPWASAKNRGCLSGLIFHPVQSQGQPGGRPSEGCQDRSSQLPHQPLSCLS